MITDTYAYTRKCSDQMNFLPNYPPRWLEAQRRHMNNAHRIHMYILHSGDRLWPQRNYRSRKYFLAAMTTLTYSPAPQV